jgi:hypothetical protein
MGWHGPVPAEKPQNLDSWGSTDSFIESVFINFMHCFVMGLFKQPCIA